MMMRFVGVTVGTNLFTTMARGAKGTNKRSLRATRADDDDDENDCAVSLARIQELSSDKKRFRTSKPEMCARLDVATGASSRIDWSTHFDPAVADTFTLARPVKTTRRHANSVRHFYLSVSC